MRVKENEFPVVVQAYDNNDRVERFVAEQVVNTQADIDSFTARYAGLVIKARTLGDTELERQGEFRNKKRVTRSGSNVAIWLVVIILVVALVAFGLYTGWIQRTFGLDLSF